MSHPSPAPALAARAVVLLAAVLTALLGALAIGAAPAHAAQHTITIKQYAFQPASMSIRQGDTITWTNQDGVGHDVEVTSGPATFHSPMLSQGQSWSFTFSAPGSYSYICSVHPDMRAAVTVAAAPVQQAPQQQAPPPAQHRSHAGTTTSDHSVTTAPKHPAKGGTKAAQHPAAAPAAPAPSVVTPGSDASLDPLLLVAGIAVAVVVFCLLLLTSRPERPLLAPASPAPPAGGDHRADAEPDDPADTAVDLPAVDKVPAS